MFTEITQDTNEVANDDMTNDDANETFRNAFANHK